MIMRFIRSGSMSFAMVACAVLGAASARATVVTYTAVLSGLAEAPPNASPGFGSAVVDIDAMAHTMHVHADFAGLVGTTSASHIHAATAAAGVGTAGVATTVPTFAGFPLGVTAGSYDIVLDTTLASSWNPAYITAHGGTPLSAEADFFAAVAAGKSYFNIHTSAFPGGEIRGFLIPSPGAAAMIGLGGLLAARRRR